MNPILTVIIALLVVLIIVVAYNMHKENQYRKKIRSQFGHSDQDALMNSHTVSVRDGQNFAPEEAPAPLRRMPLSAAPETPVVHDIREPLLADVPPLQRSDAADSVLPSEATAIPDAPAADSENPSVDVAAVAEAAAVLESPAAGTEETVEIIEIAETAEETAPAATPVAAAVVRQNELAFDSEPPAARRFLIGTDALAQLNLAWFDKRFDYTAYVALPEVQTLRSIPRFSGRCRFQIVGNTLDGRFQAAEPIPGVAYQAFVIGLQAISRNGLAQEQDLAEFEQQVIRFARQLGGEAAFAERAAFLAQAQAWDEMCARVDQTIAIHLVSRRNTVSGTELRTVLEQHGFVLQNNGSFAAIDGNGNATFTVVPLDGSGFTDALLASQPYKGFSMLFDITRIDGGAARFNKFMDQAVNLSADLELELVDDQIQPLSTEWLKEVRNYVAACQQEMQEADIVPGSPLAKRLFA